MNVSPPKPSSGPASRPKLGPMATFLALLLTCLVLGGAAGAASVLLRPDGGIMNAIVPALILALVFVAVFFISLKWWRTLDEAAQEAHKWAWWWGGSWGMAAGFIVIGGFYLLDRDAVVGSLLGDSSTAIFYHGALAIVLAQTLGYALCWSLWWLSRR
jgi:hypothetical protein